MKRLKTVTAVAAAVCCFTATTQATLFLPGAGDGSIGGPGSVIGGGASLIASCLNVAFADAGGAFSGLLSTYVYSGDANNSLGGYTFEYVLSSDVGSDHDLARLTVNGWKGAGKIGLESGFGSAFLADEGDRSAAGTVGFDWLLGNRITAGSSVSVIIYSSLNHYKLTTAQVIDGGVAGGIKTLAVPEPTTVIAGALLLLPFGLSTVRFMRNRATV